MDLTGTSESILDDSEVPMNSKLNIYFSLITNQSI